METTEVTVGRIGRAHGIKGEVSVEVRTDEPGRRFADGAVLLAGSGRRLTVVGSRWHQGRLLVRFQECADRTAAEELRGVMLSAQVDPGENPEDPDEFYDHQLVGLRVETEESEHVGTVASLVHGPQDLLVVDGVGGREVLIPFVTELVPVVDLDQGVVVVVDLPGLLREVPSDPAPDKAEG